MYGKNCKNEKVMKNENWYFFIFARFFHTNSYKLEGQFFPFCQGGGQEKILGRYGGVGGCEKVCNWKNSTLENIISMEKFQIFLRIWANFALQVPFLVPCIRIFIMFSTSSVHFMVLDKKYCQIQTKMSFFSVYTQTSVG